MRGESVATLLIIAAAFLLVRPYTGIRHDGTLYAGDALVRLIPDGFQDDLYFLFGSQGRFTLLPRLYAALISTFGLGAGTIVGLLSSFGLYLAATWSLVSALVPRSMRVWCVLSVTLGWTLYGGNRVFGYSEPFLTARSLAEPAVLFGLALLVRGRVGAAALIFGVGLVIHPLIAAGGCLAAWIYLMQQDRRWWIAAPIGGVALIALGLAASGPFADVFHRYDADWLALVHEANPHAFVLRWSLLDLGVIAYDAVVLWFAMRLPAAAPLRRFSIAAAAAGLGATLVSLLLVDLGDSSFFGKLQVWRAGWVLQWAAMAALPMVVDALRRGPDQHGRAAAGFLAIGWMTPFTAAPAFLGLLAAAIEAAKARFVVSRATTRLVWGAAGLVALVVVVQQESRVFKFGDLLQQSPWAIAGQALAVNLVVAGLAFVAIRLVPRLGRAAPAAALLLLVVAAGLWDQRGPWTRKLESYPTGTHVWAGLVEPAAKVYWYRDLIAPWVLLGHGNYYTQQQGSGAVFSRDMVIELDKRRKVTALLDFQEQICRMMNNLSQKQGSCEPDAEAVRSVCSEGAIDYVVLQSSLEGTPPLADLATGVIENGYEKRFYLYRCSALEPR